MFCPKCGSNVPDEAKFCTYCGEPIETLTRYENQPWQQSNQPAYPPPNTQSPSSRPSRSGNQAAGAIVVFIVIAAILIISGIITIPISFTAGMTMIVIGIIMVFCLLSSCSGGWGWACCAFSDCDCGDCDCDC